MKHIAIALVIGAAALAANSARADSRVSIGINVGTPVYRSAPIYTPAPVYAPAPAVVYAPAPAVVVPARSHGYWKEVQVKTWVPERWVLRTSRWGRTERVCEPGYFAYHTDRVWVDGRDNRHDNRGNYSYGYNNRGYDNRGYDSRGNWNR
ncbi:MAG TPA: hypothetical protein VM029_02450 [Opitutaceae bacterium]|nr:hypothetical protein [Opitutaceae bacterium]